MYLIVPVKISRGFVIYLEVVLSMEKLFNATFLISGTAIGAGLMALPLTVVNVGPNLTVLILVCAVFVAYRSSIMTIELNEAKKEAVSIVDLSRSISGKKAAWISMVSFHTLSLALLTVYFSCMASTLASFCPLHINSIIVGCSLFLFIILSLKDRYFLRLSTMLVATLLTIITSCLLQFYFGKGGGSYSTLAVPKEVMSFIPVVFTSFGVQNICASIHDYLGGNERRIKIAFFVGIVIPAFIYLAWIVSVLGTVSARDAGFFERMRLHQVSVGELIAFLCSSSKIAFMDTVFKTLSLFAIATSAIGIGVGLQKSLGESITSSKYSARFVVCTIPAIVCMTIRDAFLNILSFGAMMAVVFVIFVPFYLKRKLGSPLKLGDWLVLCAGGLIVACEAAQIFMK